MCAIAGLFLPDGAKPLTADLARMLDVMAHRGPDGRAHHVSGDGRYQAGFARLAIIDLETGDQPIVEAGGARVLMGNGEIYNYLELRGRPEAGGYAYQTRGDMEVILPLADCYGAGFVDHLNGMFAVALYERRAHRLTLVRDRMGVKPLYWCRLEGGGVLFASEPKALFASGLIVAEIDEAAAASYMVHGYVPAPATLYRGVNKLPQGHRLIATASGTISVERYWKPRKPAIPADPQELEDHLIDLLRDSVRLQLRADVPLGVLLSGGLDSGLLVALAAAQSGRPLSTFSVRFEGATYDETPLARTVAGRYGTNHHDLRVAANGIGDALVRLAWFCDEPVMDPALLPNFLIEQELGRHMKVALNGTGGDELFAGYGRYFPMPVERRYLALPAWLRAGVEGAVRPVSPMTAWRLGRAPLFEHDRGRYLAEQTGFFPGPIRQLIGFTGPVPDPVQVSHFADFDGPAQSAALYADQQSYLVEDLLTLLDRTSMAVGVEGRVPFLDHRLVEAALAVPPELRAPGDRQKHLERRMAARFLPPSVIDAPKRGFAAPVPAWMRAGLGGLAKRLLGRRAALARGWWTAEGIGRLAADPGRHGFRLYALMMLELAVRLHVEGVDRATPLAELAADG